MDPRKSFFDDVAPDWDGLLARDMRADKLNHMVDRFAIPEGDAILDVGTGTGVLLPFLGKAIGPTGTLVAIDFSFKMLTAAASHGFDPQPAFLNAGVAAIPFKQGSFDKVTCFSAFPHFPDKAKALSEMVRVLKKGGALFIAHLHSIEEINQLHHAVGGPVMRDRLPDREAMGRLMRDAGLSKIEIENEPGRFLALGRKS
jgi:ubiquinone/menaquinone biosynthesis C-methylase UbiE